MEQDKIYEVKLLAERERAAVREAILRRAKLLNEIVNFRY